MKKFLLALILGLPAVAMAQAVSTGTVTAPISARSGSAVTLNRPSGVAYFDNGFMPPQVSTTVLANWIPAVAGEIVFNITDGVMCHSILTSPWWVLFESSSTTGAYIPCYP